LNQNKIKIENRSLQFATIFCIAYKVRQSFWDIFIYCDHKVVNMPRAGEGRSIRIDPEVYEALLMLKRGNMTFSDVIEQMLKDCYGWSDELSASQSNLEDFTDINIR